MSGPGRFSLFGGDEEEEFPHNPITEEPLFASGNPIPAIAVPPTIAEVQESAFASNLGESAHDTLLSGLLDVPAGPDLANQTMDTPLIVPTNGALTSRSSDTSVIPFHRAEESAHTPSSIDRDVAVPATVLGADIEGAPSMPGPIITPNTVIPHPIRVNTTLIPEEELGNGTLPIVSRDPPQDIPKPSEERAKFAADAFIATGNLQAATQAITDFKILLNAGSDLPAAKRAEIAEVLSTVLSQRFQHFGDVDDMEGALEAQLQVTALALEEGADPALRAKSHGGLGRTLTAQFEYTGDPDDAKLAIDQLSRALRMMPVGHPDRPAVLADFARVELAQYAHSDDSNLLQQALVRCEEALGSISEEAPERVSFSVLFGGALLSRFERTHSPEDIARAVAYLEFAVMHTPEVSPERSKRMQSYGDALLARSVLENDLASLNFAIRTQESALELLTPEHAAYPALTGSLARAFHTRFRGTSNVKDLDKAIDKFKTSVELTPFTDPNYARITDLLGKSFMAKYRAATQPPRTQFLDYAITLHRQAVALTSPDHRHYAGRLESLGKAYSKRYRSMLRRQSATETDLQEAERCLREAMKIDPSRADRILQELGKLNQQQPHGIS
ncbi:unnamed protein product [Rhizoctonia solani]|uniref:Uncharacterized protein n=1 Tax=Rhizoctonia solani TaxID=456999 RepID=A0A8H3AIC2_9AGAM|nr:unnamed protein product [Rhizoctonia solani]